MTSLASGRAVSMLPGHANQEPPPHAAGKLTKRRRRTPTGLLFQGLQNSLRVSRTLSDAFPFRRIPTTALEVRSYYVPHLTEKGSEGHMPKGNQVPLTSPTLDPSAC